MSCGRLTIQLTEKHLYLGMHNKILCNSCFGEKSLREFFRMIGLKLTEEVMKLFAKHKKYKFYLLWGHDLHSKPFSAAGENLDQSCTSLIKTFFQICFSDISRNQQNTKFSNKMLTSV